ncbi:hypothetical protein HPB48_025105 [Haemaphysalis longicornis]|uniref:Transposable element P transposase-like GTP-binding insertion domain-containing protein n=1 Tax=Haemaphysalis longicornis TaxID=44386 RepID=A0A9J6H9W1_HAELO|nr:hypothetical protein HPB48_025105 [Haemaphysalis longicornis]
MKVKVAAKTFSSSVSKSLDLARRLELRQFEACAGTAKFIADVDRYVVVQVNFTCNLKSIAFFSRLFDLLNSQNPTSMDLKAPLRPASFQRQKETMLEMSAKLTMLRLPTGDLVCTSGRRMSVIALLSL